MLLDTGIRNLIVEEKALEGYFFFFTLFGLIVLPPTLPVTGK